MPYLTAKKAVEIYSIHEDTIIKGKLGLLLYTPQFWTLVIEGNLFKDQ